jgi:hypothetical protein
MCFMLNPVCLNNLDQSSIYIDQFVPVKKGILNLRENSGLLIKFNLSLDIPVAYPALSKYSETISKKEGSPATLKFF